MLGVVEGFSTLGVVIAVGWLLARLRVVDFTAQTLLTRLAFFVASPALMITVLSGTEPGTLLSKNLIALVGALLVSAGTYALIATFVLAPRSIAHTVIGALCAAQVNAANLGIPIAVYVLGDAALIAPILLTQMLVLQPLALAVLDRDSSSVAGGGFMAWGNPLTLGALLGFLLAIFDISLPSAVEEPIALIAGMAVPAMLLAFGISLHRQPQGTPRTPRRELAVVAGLKLVVQPAVAFLIARFALGLDDDVVFAATVIAALPSAQNIFVIASRYDRATVLARDAISATTITSAPAILLIAAILT